MNWLLLLHLLPPNPPALRVRVWRRLQSLGAYQLKPSVYLLPATDEAREDFAWIAREIREAGAEASIWQVQGLDGPSDADLVQAFESAAAQEYNVLIEDLRAAEPQAIPRLRSRFTAIVARDYFAAPGREVAGALLVERECRPDKETFMSAPFDIADFQGKTWVTRAGIKIDRMASAWLIRRFIDPGARFRFTRDPKFLPQVGELRFDMYEGEFGHEGAACTFETLIGRFGLSAAGLKSIAEIVHDIDLKENRYGRPETAGIAALIDGIVVRRADDEERLADAARLFDSLFAQFESSVT